MPRIDQNKAQAITELAVFGVILIYLLGTIIRSAVGNSLTQNENFKAMRMAMLSSWEGSLKGNIARNSASVLFIEDRLSPDFNKYGDLDRNPYIANGSGTFSYQLLYPLTPGDGDNMPSQMPVMDVYINGQYFPFITAGYVANQLLVSPADSAPAGPNNGDILSNCTGNEEPTITRPLTTAQCLQNQCLRYRREWIGGSISAAQFNNAIEPVALSSNSGCGTTTPLTKTEKLCQAQFNGNTIFNLLIQAPPALIKNVISGTYTGTIDTTEFPAQWSTFAAAYSNSYATYFPGVPASQASAKQIQKQLDNIYAVLAASPANQYKLFYTIVANDLIPQATQATPAFSVNPPGCASHPCKDQELSSNMSLGGVSNAKGDLMFDLQRNATSANYPATLVPSSDPTSSHDIRPYMAWQWAATAGTTAGMIGLNTSNNQFPNYDIDGRLKEVTIYTISGPNAIGEPTVSYSDPQMGDIDGAWDTNSCTPKPGLQSDAQVYTFTQNGTYLQIKEGQLLNPETGQVVRSQAKRDTIDLIQRAIQLSNDTRRFCNGAQPQPCIENNIYGTCTSPTNPYGNDPNPVEVCIPKNSTQNCFNSEMNIKSTCFDENNMMLYVRSRLQDLRGHLWVTNTTGQLKVQQ